MERYVDDILEVVRKEAVNNLTEHLNKIDNTNSIKFTYEEEKDGKMPFLDTLIVRRDDGSSRVDKQRNEPGRWKSRIVAIFLLFLTLLHVLT